jgi:predicted alpha/beta hydrolase
MVTPTAEPEPFSQRAADGFLIKGFLWRRSAAGAGERPAVVINPATSVRCRYYARFAAYLFGHGFDVITYDYRGIGESRPRSLRGFRAGWVDWGHLDCDAALRFAAASSPGRPIHVVAHSIGGFVLGLAGLNHLVERACTVGAQYAYWPDYAARSRLRMVMRWHVVMPLITAACGYFPGKRLGWLEDTPAGVVLDWAFSRRRCEDAWPGRASRRHPGRRELLRRFAAMSAATLAVSVTDDEFGTVPAVERLLAYFTGSPRKHLRVSPESVGVASIGHFAFFNSRFAETLWPLVLGWLRAGQLPAGYPGTLIDPEGSRNGRPADAPDNGSEGHE